MSEKDSPQPQPKAFTAWAAVILDVAKKQKQAAKEEQSKRKTEQRAAS